MESHQYRSLWIPQPFQSNRTHNSDTSCGLLLQSRASRPPHKLLRGLDWSVDGRNSACTRGSMPEARHSEVVDATPEAVWALLMDKMENPSKYVPGVQECRILRKDGPYSMLRRMKTGDFEVEEEIVADAEHRSVDFVLVDHPFYTGKVTNVITVGPKDETTLTFHLQWVEKEGAKAPPLDPQEAVRKAVVHTKELAEGKQ